MTDIFLSARNEKYKTRALAEKNIPKEYEIIEDAEGFYGVRKTGQSGLPVLCPYCRESHFKTTDQYNPDETAHPGMIKMIEPYLSYGWQQPPQDPTAGYGVLECCECGSPLAPDGFLTVEGGE